VFTILYYEDRKENREDFSIFESTKTAIRTIGRSGKEMTGYIAGYLSISYTRKNKLFAYRRCIFSILPILSLKLIKNSKNEYVLCVSTDLDKYIV